MNTLIKQLLSVVLVLTLAVSNNISTYAFVPKDDDTSIEDNGSW